MNRITLLWVCIIFAVVGGSFYYLYKNNTHTGEQSMVELDSSVIVLRKDIPQGWKEYRNEQYKFSVLHPRTLSVSERFEVGGVITIVFENIKEQKGFQVFIVPYTEDQISEERFRKDVPSGIRKNIEDITIDGISAVAFYSMDEYLGDIREVWFIAHGFLYEVSTIKSYEKTLSDILLTWIFIE